MKSDYAFSTRQNNNKIDKQAEVSNSKRENKSYLLQKILYTNMFLLNETYLLE